MHLPHRALAVLVCLAGGLASAAGPDAGSERLRAVDAAERCAEIWRRLRESAKTRSLAPLAALSPAESRALVEQSLRALAQPAARAPRSE